MHVTELPDSTHNSIMHLELSGWGMDHIPQSQYWLFNDTPAQRDDLTKVILYNIIWDTEVLFVMPSVTEIQLNKLRTLFPA